MINKKQITTMKKLTLAALAAVVAAGFMSCGNSTPKANLKSDIDSVSYAYGIMHSQGLEDYLVRGMGIDTAYMDEFYRGLNAGVNAGDDKKKMAYYAGIQIGQMISNQMVKGINNQLFGSDSTKTISLKNLMSGFLAGAKGEKPVITPEQAQMLLNIKIQQIRSRELAKQYGSNKAAGEKFVAEYAKKAGVKKLDGGVLYRVIKEGKGAVPADSSVVRVHYEGKTIDGKVFESSYEDGKPIQLRPNQFIPGWRTALTHMPVGSVWEVVIPQDQAYGERETPNFKPYSALVFKMELVGIGAEKK